ncbi:unnamed protein product [Ectocarpus sp. CCAP 1310/34]|nr:unnamed protein product [Ectocarpus sp. CCAP 1310/34]
MFVWGGDFFTRAGQGACRLQQAGAAEGVSVVTTSSATKAGLFRVLRLAGGGASDGPLLVVVLLEGKSREVIGTGSVCREGKRLGVVSV